MHKPVKYVEKAVTVAAKGAWAVFDRLNRIKPNPSPTPKWSDKPLLKSYEKTKPPLGWPRTTDSLCPKCVPEIRQQILDGKLPLRSSAQREGRRDQGADHRARWQDPDGEGLPDPRPLRRRDVDRHRVLQAPGRGFPRPRHPRPQRRKAAQPRLQHRHPRPRLGAHHRSDQPLQHDVRSLLHGCQPGRLRPRTDLGRHQDDARQRHHHQAAPPDVGAVLRRRADAFAVLPGCRPLRPQSRIQQRAGRDQRHRIRQEPRVLHSRPPKPGCATPTCSSTASATPPTRTARSATCST